MSRGEAGTIGTVEQRHRTGVAHAQRRLAAILAAVAVLVALLVSLLIAGPSLGKPYVMDEMEFPSVARAIAETGKPVYYRSELFPENVGLWHPPLYILWYGGWTALFGPSIMSGRLFGLVNLWLALAVIAAFAWRRWRDAGDERPTPLMFGAALLASLGLMATAPLLVQGAILPDIDTQVLPLTLTAFVLLMFELRRCGVRGGVYWGAFVAGLLVQLYAKLPAMILLVPTFVAFELADGLFRRDVIRARVRRTRGDGPERPGSYRLLVVVSRHLTRAVARALLVLVALAAALALLTGSWFILASLWGVSFSLPFVYLTQSANNPANLAGADGPLGVILAELPQRFNYARQWIGLPAFAFVALLIVREFAAPARGLLVRTERVALYTFLGVLFALYMVLRPAPFDFPKYYPPLIPFLGLLAADLLTALLRPQRAVAPLALFGSLVALYLAYTFLSPMTAGIDFILLFYISWPKTAPVLYWMLLPLAAALVVAAVAALALRRRLIDFLALAALAVCLGWQLNVSWRQSRADYSTTYMYGERTLNEVTQYLRETMPADALLVAPKDIGFQLQDRWRYYELFADPRAELAQPGVQYLVMREFDYYGNTIRETPEIAAYVQANYELERRIGAFLVMKKRATPGG